MSVGIALTLLLIGTPYAQADPANEYFKKGRRAARQGDFVTAYLYFSQAVAADPTDMRFTRAVEAARERAGQTLAGLGNYQAAAAVDSSQSHLLENAEEPSPSAQGVAGKPPRRLKSPVRLRPNNKVAGFKLRDTVGTIYETVAREFGLDVIFDRDFDKDREIRFELDDADFRQAIRVLNQIAGAFTAPVLPGTFLVAEDSQQKRSELEPVATVMIPIPDAMTDEEMQQLAQAVQQILDVKRLQVDRARRQIVMRDTVHRVRLAQEMYRQLSQPRAEVVIDVDLVAAGRTDQIDFGVTLPTVFPLTNFSTILWNSPPQFDGSTPLLGIGGGKTVFGLQIGPANLTAQRTQGSSRTLSSFRLRSADGLPANLSIGERFPIINASFSAAVTNQQVQDEIDQGTLRQPFPSFTFEDLGLNFTATPHVHDADEISLELELEVQLLSGNAVNDIPILSNRSFNSSVRLQEGEAAFITGMRIYERRRNRSGPAGLSEIPLLGWLFRDESRQYNVSDLVLSIRPRIVRLPPAEVISSVALHYGSENRPLSAL